MIACPSYIFRLGPLDTITPISPRAIPEQGNRAEVVLVVLHRWSLETFCMMYNVQCTHIQVVFSWHFACDYVFPGEWGPFLV